MHIVHVIARLNDGGPARVLACLARACAARGHRTTVLAGRCAAGEPDLGAVVAAAGAAVEQVPGLGRAVRPGDDLRALGRLTTRLRALRPDVVHTHTAKAGALGRLACRRLGLPCLHTYHGHVLDGYFSPAVNLALRCAERLLAGTAHHQALTPGLLRELRDRHRIGRPRRWHCLAIPVEPVAPVRRGQAPWHGALATGRPVVAFLGRLAPVKDPWLWLEAFATLAATRPVQGLVCGDGLLRPALEEHARRLGVPVLFTGFVPAAEALAAADLLLMSSRNEGLPLVAVEAGAAGVPVAAPAVGGLRDLVRLGAVEGGARSAAGLAAAAARLLDDPGLRRRRLAAGAALAAGLAPAALAPRYEALYRAVAAGGHRC